jgi:hypothetical protein
MVTATCTCGHRSAVAVAVIKAKLPGWYRVSDLGRVLRCRRCNYKGDAVVDARVALGFGRH